MAVGLKLGEGLKTESLVKQKPPCPRLWHHNTGALLSELRMNTQHEQILMSEDMSVNVI